MQEVPAVSAEAAVGLCVGCKVCTLWKAVEQPSSRRVCWTNRLSTSAVLQYVRSRYYGNNSEAFVMENPRIFQIMCPAL